MCHAQIEYHERSFMKILITGTSGFIGFHLAKRLLDEEHDILGVDNFCDYYDVRLKEFPACTC